MHRIIIADTSVLLNFVCSRQHRFLIIFSNPIGIDIPPAVRDEVERKLTNRRFSRGIDPWNYRLREKYIRVLQDSDRVWNHVRGYADFGYTTDGGLAKNLGEYLAIAHCLEIRERFPTAMIALLMDDSEGREIARKRKISAIFGTEDVLLRAIQLGHISSRGEAKMIWEKLQQFDTLEPFDYTALNNRKLYNRAKE